MPCIAPHELNMKTKPIPKLQSRVQMERAALQLLCSVHVKPGTRLEICRLLDPQDFLDPLRKAVFEEVRAAGMISSRGLRASLTARMVNRGYPGFDLDQLLSPKSVDADE